METIEIRAARKEDLETLLSFEQGVINAERPFDPTLRKGQINYYDIAAMIEASHIQLVVAEVAGVLVGSGYARIEEAKPYLDHAEYAYLGFMYVRPEYRGRGINQMIVDALKSWAISKGIWEIRLDVYSPNQQAIRAYEKAGFSPYMLCMRMGLDQSEK